MEGQISTMFINNCLGKEVNDNSGNKCGNIKEFLIDIDNNSVPFVVLGEGGIMGTGMADTSIIVPLGATKMQNSEAAQYFIDASQDKLQHAPRYDKKKFGEQNPQLFIEIHDYYGTEQDFVRPGPISEAEQEHQSYREIAFSVAS